MAVVGSKKLDLVIRQGSRFERLLVWTDENYTPIDLRGWTAAMQIRPAVGSPTVLTELTTANGRIVLGGSTGSITLKLSAEETRSFTWTKGVYDLELIPPLGPDYVERLLEGTVTVSPEVTR